MNRRLRKKKRVREFAEFGFSVEIVFVDGLSEEDADTFLDDWIISAIEANGLLFGGGGDAKMCGGYVSLDGRGTATENHRRIIDEWLSAHPNVHHHVVGPLTDANK
jgi:uncharacterized protein YggL (DUF469 family)